MGIPVMMAEILLGRLGRHSPINTMRELAAEQGASPFWSWVGWDGVAAGFLILSYYVVIAGWALYYIMQMGSGALEGATAEQAGTLFANFLADPLKLVFWQTLFMILTVYIISRGVISGLETAVRVHRRYGFSQITLRTTSAELVVGRLGERYFRTTTPGVLDDPVVKRTLGELDPARRLLAIVPDSDGGGSRGTTNRYLASSLQMRGELDAISDHLAAPSLTRTQLDDRGIHES